MFGVMRMLLYDLRCAGSSRWVKVLLSLQHHAAELFQ